MKQLKDPSCNSTRWQHLPWVKRSPRPHQKLMEAICANCPAFDDCAAMVAEMIARGETGAGFLAGRTQTDRALEVSSHAREPEAGLLSETLASTSKRG